MSAMNLPGSRRSIIQVHTKTDLRVARIIQFHFSTLIQWWCIHHERLRTSQTTFLSSQKWQPFSHPHLSSCAFSSPEKGVVPVAVSIVAYHRRKQFGTARSLTVGSKNPFHVDSRRVPNDHRQSANYRHKLVLFICILLIQKVVHMDTNPRYGHYLTHAHSHCILLNRIFLSAIFTP